MTNAVASREEERKYRKARELLSDAFTFVRSMEANKAMSEVTLDDLLMELIDRNGESSKSAQKKYNPYAYNEKAAEPMSMPTVTQSGPAGNPVSGTDFSNPTKMDRLLALESAIESTVDQIKSEEPISTEDLAERGSG